MRKCSMVSREDMVNGDKLFGADERFQGFVIVCGDSWVCRDGRVVWNSSCIFTCDVEFVARADGLVDTDLMQTLRHFSA